MLLGNYNECTVEDEKPQGFYVSVDGERVLLPKSKAPDSLKIGDKIKLFIYLDNEARPIATTQKALACANEFAVLKVKDVNDIGAFLDWGLDKDLLLPYKNQLGELRSGDLCVVYVEIDSKTNRLTATEKIRKFFERDLSGLKEGEEVSLIAYDFTEKRCIDFVVNKRWTGRFYCDPEKSNFHIGDECTGFVHSAKDGLITLSLSPIGFDALVDRHRDSLLELIKNSGGFLPLSDNSSSEEIREKLGMSKKGFKKLAGTLWKEGIVELSKDGIKLC